MHKLFSCVLALGLAVPQLAWALQPGTYIAKTSSEEGMFGKLVICHLAGDTAGKQLPDLDFFSITTYNGVEPINLYAGVLNTNTADEAKGTVMFTLTNSERFECGWKGNFCPGKWLKDIKTTQNNISISKVAGNKLCFQGLNGANLIYANMTQDYKYTSGSFSGENELALKIVALAKVRELQGEKQKVAKQSYKFEHNDDDNQHILTVVENGEYHQYVIADNLSSIAHSSSEGTPTQAMLTTEPAQGTEQTEQTEGTVAVITGTDVLVRQEANTHCEILGVVNTGDKVTVLQYVDGGYVDGNYQWAQVVLSNGTRGYIYGKYVKEQ